MQNFFSSSVRALPLCVALGASSLTLATPSTADNSSICSSPPEDEFFSIFQCGRLLEIGYVGDLSALSNYSRAEALHYISGLSNGLHGPSAAFFLSPELLIARDPHLPRRVSIMMLSDRNVLEDTFSDVGSILGAIGGSWLQERQEQQRNGTLDPLGELEAVGEGAAQAQGSSILWAARYGGHDFQILAAISQSDPDLAIAIYEALHTVLEAL